MLWFTRVLGSISDSLLSQNRAGVQFALSACSSGKAVDAWIASLFSGTAHTRTQHVPPSNQNTCALTGHGVSERDLPSFLAETQSDFFFSGKELSAKVRAPIEQIGIKCLSIESSFAASLLSEVPSKFAVPGFARHSCILYPVTVGLEAYRSRLASYLRMTGIHELGTLSKDSTAMEFSVLNQSTISGIDAVCHWPILRYVCSISSMRRIFASDASQVVELPANSGTIYFALPSRLPPTAHDTTRHSLLRQVRLLREKSRNPVVLYVSSAQDGLILSGSLPKGSNCLIETPVIHTESTTLTGNGELVTHANPSLAERYLWRDEVTKRELARENRQTGLILDSRGNFVSYAAPDSLLKSVDPAFSVQGFKNVMRPNWIPTKVPMLRYRYRYIKKYRNRGYIITVKHTNKASYRSPFFNDQRLPYPRTRTSPGSATRVLQRYKQFIKERTEWYDAHDNDPYRDKEAESVLRKPF